MIQYTNGKFICAGRVAVKLPDDVWLDFDPPVIPANGMIFHSPDQKTRIDVDILETAQDARTYLQEFAEGYETYQPIRELRRVSVGSLGGYGLTYATEHEIYEEYALTIPGDVPALLNVCLMQEISDPSDQKIYIRIRNELLAGIELY